MSAECKAKFIVELTGLGEEITIAENFTTTTPDGATYNYRTQATGGTEEALDLGDVSTVEFVVIKAVTNDLQIDTSYAADTFSAELEVPEGKAEMFRPVDGNLVYVKNKTGSEVCVYEYLVVGTS